MKLKKGRLHKMKWQGHIESFFNKPVENMSLYSARLEYMNAIQRIGCNYFNVKMKCCTTCYDTKYK